MLQEEKVIWKNGSLTGEGLLSRSDGHAGVVICHPHPLMGGSMHDNVVDTIQKTFARHNYSTLRFNFRGVGGSTGSYDEGRGEKQDILSACEYLKQTGIEKITLAGYSFGAWVSCHLLKEKPVMIASAILISPPQKYFDFNWVGLEDTVELMICGDSDPFCDADELMIKAEMIHAKLKILQSTDHFYTGKEEILADQLVKYINEKKVNMNEKKA